MSSRRCPHTACKKWTDIGARFCKDHDGSKSTAIIPKINSGKKIIGWNNINPILKMLLLGTHSSQSPLRLLRGTTNTLLKKIYQLVVLFWKANIVQLPNSYITGYEIKFPEPKNININMMPFEIDRMNSLPKNLHQYWPLIERCSGLDSKICYLTIVESFVKAGQTQRRGGLHTESPGYLHLPGKTGLLRFYIGWGGPSNMAESNNLQFHGGIFMASNINDTCRIFPYQLTKHGDMVGEGGDMGFLREFLLENKLLSANCLTWLTDTTPHESLPVTKDCYRQFFRVVGKVTAWYKQHSTPNPLGIKDENVKILTNNKF